MDTAAFDSRRLVQLQELTDAALAHLEIDELLDELLGRVRQMLEADTAAILLVADDDDTLVARAAKGLEEEVEDEVRIPVGKGFAGRIAAERRPVIVPDVEHADILNPILREKAVRSLLGVPLLVAGELTGVLHVGSLRPRTFEPTDVALLQLVADRCALAIAHAQLYEAERHARADAEAANAAKNQFLSHMSHELRTPLAAVIGFAELLLRRAQEDQQRLWIEHIVDAGRHLQNLVTELLEISLIESGTLVVNIEPITIKETIDEALTFATPLALENAVRIEPVRGDALGATVSADARRLRQVLVNLLSNAIKYNRSGGTVTISVDRAGADRVRLAVSDTGLGLTPEQLARLFVPFERLGASHGPVEGSGLGLVVTKGLVETMQGELTVTSDPEIGTTFAVDLPAARVEAKRPEAPSERPLVSDGTVSGDVLYIEDHAANVELIRNALSELRPGIALRVAVDGESGLREVAAQAPDVVLLDLNLPDIPGEDVLRRMRREAGLTETPIVVVSADSTPATIARLRDLDAIAYVTKPIDLPRLLDVLDGVLRRRSGGEQR